MEPYYSEVPPSRSPPPVYHYPEHLKSDDKRPSHFRTFLIIYSGACFTICCSTIPVIPFLVGHLLLIVMVLLGIVHNGFLFGGAVGRDLPILRINKNFTLFMIILHILFLLSLINTTITFLVLKDRENIKLYMNEYYPKYSLNSIENAIVAVWIFSVLAGCSQVFFFSHITSPLSSYRPVHSRLSHQEHDQTDSRRKYENNHCLEHPKMLIIMFICPLTALLLSVFRYFVPFPDYHKLLTLPPSAVLTVTFGSVSHGSRRQIFNRFEIYPLVHFLSCF